MPPKAGGTRELVTFGNSARATPLGAARPGAVGDIVAFTAGNGRSTDRRLVRYLPIDVRAARHGRIVVFARVVVERTR